MATWSAACRHLSLCVGGVCAKYGREIWIQREKIKKNMVFQFWEQIWAPISGSEHLVLQRTVARARVNAGVVTEGWTHGSARLGEPQPRECADKAATWRAVIGWRRLIVGAGHLVQDRSFGRCSDGRHVFGLAPSIFGCPKVVPQAEFWAIFWIAINRVLILHC